MAVAGPRTLAQREVNLWPYRAANRIGEKIRYSVRRAGRGGAGDDPAQSSTTQGATHRRECASELPP